MDSGEPGIIDIERYRLDFHPEEKVVLCGVAPGHTPEDAEDAMSEWDGTRDVYVRTLC